MTSMAAVQPIPLDQRTLRNPLRPEFLTWRLDRDSDDDEDEDEDSSVDSSDSDADVSSSSSDALDSSSVASSSGSDSSDQEDNFERGSDSEEDSELSSFSEQEEEEEDLGGYHSSSNESGRPAESLIYRRKRRTISLTASSLTGDLLETLGDMARTDNVGYIAWFVPFMGICTMLTTELLACANHFNCSENFPTLSYAATFRPEGYAFTGGMCLTAIFIFASVVLFFWYLRLRMEERRTQQLLAGYACLLAGVTAAISLFGLAVMDMRTHHDAHINFTIAFFIAAWMTMIAVQSARKTVLHEDEAAGDDGKTSSSAGLLVVLRRRSFWLSLRRWRRLDVFTAYTLGRLFLNVGLASTFLFALFFLCANGVWPNPLGFTAVQEAFFEALAIVCQLLFMGTLSCELARLAKLVERSDFAELERNE